MSKIILISHNLIDSINDILNSDQLDPVILLIWILPIFIFLIFGQHIQLYITAMGIKKNITKLKKFKDSSRNELLYFAQNDSSIINKLDYIIDYFTVLPVDLDPHDIILKIKHVVYSREITTRHQLSLIFSNYDELQLTIIQTLLEIVSLLQLFYKSVMHIFLTAKKQHNYPLILPLQMTLPTIMEEAYALKESVHAIKNGKPIGDGIGPMIISNMINNATKELISFKTILSKSEYDTRLLYYIKAEGPYSTTGRIGDAVELLFKKHRPTIIIMVDAAIRLEGEKSGVISEGFGPVIGGIGIDQFKIEKLATQYEIPILSIIIKQSIYEAMTLMTKEISNQVNYVKSRIYEIITENTKPHQSVLIIGVGNTSGIL